MKLSEIGEFGVVSSIRSDLKDFQKQVIAGIGDDTAAIELSGKKLVLFTSDTLVEDIHFKWDYFSPSQVGWKAMVVNVSDIAAVGGSPTHCLVSLALPAHTDMIVVREVYRGLKRAASRYRVGIVGGDIVCAPSFIITVSLLGEAKRENIVLRSGAKRGDLIYVTGQLGSSEAGLACLKRSNWKVNPKIRQFLIKRHLMPSPRLVEGQKIANSQIATSMIDLSDGLASDLHRLAEESKVGAILWEDELPIAPATEELAKVMGKSSLEWVLYGGEDYELLFTVPPNKSTEVEQNLGFPHALIGEVVDSDQGIYLKDRKGNRTKVEDRGYHHFSGPTK
ncbi:MAG: thiamine-phosphate kinase [Candidatus Aminicenantia bacterium]